MGRKRKGKGLSMRREREVLRLVLGSQMSDRMIGRSVSISHVTVASYRRGAQEAGISFSDTEKMGGLKLLRLLKVGKREDRRGDRPQPDWQWVHRKIRKKGVTLQLSWEEYKTAYPDGYQISQFYKLYEQWKGRLKVSLRQTHKAGEKVSVDYAGPGIRALPTGSALTFGLLSTLKGCPRWLFLITSRPGFQRPVAMSRISTRAEQAALRPRRAQQSHCPVADPAGQPSFQKARWLQALLV